MLKINLSFGWFTLATASLLLLATVGAATEAVARTVDLSMKTAMAMAVSNNLDLRIDALDSSMAETEVARSRGIYDPYLSLSTNSGQTFYTGETYGTRDTTASFGLTQALPTGGSLTASSYTEYSRPVSDLPGDSWTDWYSSVGVNLSQPLLKNFGKEATELSISLAANSHEGSLEQFRYSVIETVYSVIKSYNRLYTLRQVRESRQRALVAARKTLTRLKQRAKPSSQQGMDIANTEYAISQRLKDLVDAEREIDDQAAGLRYLIGVDEEISLVPLDPPSSVEPKETTEQAINLALEKRTDLKRLKLDLQSSVLEQRVSKRNLLPALSVTAGVGVRGIDDHFSDSFEQVRMGKGRWWSVGLQLSVPLGNTAARSDFHRNELRTSQQQKGLTAFEWKLRNRIESDMRALMSARIQKQVAEKAVKIAERRVKKYRTSVQLKTSKVQDLLNAESDWIGARDNQTRALESFANSVALLWKDTGVLLERMKIKVDTRQPEKLTAGTRQLPATEAVVASSLSQTSPVQKQNPSIHASVAAAQVSAKYSDRYSLVIGEFLDSELAKMKKKVENAGLVARVTRGSKQPKRVIRLMVNDYPNEQAVKKELQRLHKVGARGFVVHRGKAGFRLYAGSFFTRERALKERNRLAALGMSLTLEELSVRLPTSRLEAGYFDNWDAALAQVRKLEKLGIKSVVLKRS